MGVTGEEKVSVSCLNKVAVDMKLNSSCSQTFAGHFVVVLLFSRVFKYS